MKLHKIQKEILLVLAYNTGLRFSEIRPKLIDNDLFNYHLQYLIKNSWVEKNGQLYRITEKGVEEILLLDSTGKEYKGIRASVLVNVIDRTVMPNRILIQKRNRKPYIEEENAGISGKINAGEEIETAAKRKLLEEVGLVGKCKFVGILRKTRISYNGLIDDGIFFVCVCESWTGKIIVESPFGKNSWVDVNDAIDIQKKVISSGKISMNVLKRIIKKDYSLFFLHEKIKIESF